MSRSVSLWKLSISIFSVLGASMILPSAVADEETSAVVQESVTASQDLDYTAMNLFMERVSKTERGRPSIAYKIVRENGSEFLDEYEVYLSGIDSTALSDDERLAYWLNVQNFLVVKAVTLDTKTTKLKSLRGTGAKPGKMWTKDRFTAGGQTYSIADIETKLVSEFNNPNVIYGLYQGVKGGPCLSSTAYQGETVQARLSELGMQYVNSSGIVEPNKSVVTVTPIYDWYKAELFGNDDKLVLKHLKANAETHLRGRLNRGTQLKYTKLNYSVDNFDAIAKSKGKKGKKGQTVVRDRSRQQAPQGRAPSGGGSYGS